MEPGLRDFNASTADDAGDDMRCLAELGKIMEDINNVANGVSVDEFEKGKKYAGMGKSLLLTWEERELLDKRLSGTLKNFIAHAEVLETMQATEIERNGAGDTAFSYDRFRSLAIETRAANIIKRFTIALSGLAKLSKRDPNPYLMAFNPNEQKKYEAAKARLKEDYVFFKLMLGDLRRYKACIMRVELPYNTGRQTKANPDPGPNPKPNADRGPDPYKIQERRPIKQRKNHYESSATRRSRGPGRNTRRPSTMRGSNSLTLILLRCGSG